MHSLLGDRFLKLFAGDLKNRLKRITSSIEDHSSEARAEGVTGTNDHASEEGREKDLAACNDLLSRESKTQKKILSTNKLDWLG